MNVRVTDIFLTIFSARTRLNNGFSINACMDVLEGSDGHGY